MGRLIYPNGDLYVTLLSVVFIFYIRKDTGFKEKLKDKVLI